MKERGWFDIPVVYNNNRRACLAIALMLCAWPTFGQQPSAAMPSWEIAGNKTIVTYDIIELFARLPPQRCPRARNPQGHVAARWPTATLRPSLRAAANQSQVGHHEISRQLVEQGDEKDRGLACTIIVSYKGWASKTLNPLRTRPISLRPWRSLIAAKHELGR